MATAGAQVTRLEKLEALAAALEAENAKLRDELANRQFAAAARGKPAPVEPRHGWDVE